MQIRGSLFHTQSMLVSPQVKGMIGLLRSSAQQINPIKVQVRVSDTSNVFVCVAKRVGGR